MKRGISIGLVILISIISISVSNAIEFNAYDEIFLNLNITAAINIVPKNQDYLIEYINIYLHTYPTDDWQQEVLNLNTHPAYEIVNGTMLFRWGIIKSKDISFRVDTKIKVKNNVFPVRQKVRFPFGQLPAELTKWTAPTAKINSGSPEIIRLASSLVEGEYDLYMAVFKIANFTKNYIRYDINSAGEVKSSLWILNNKNGVCGDISSFFIALCRALNIPVKYITGVAYSTISETKQFVPHAWAEVYFPGIGWIPFDPTFGEFGYVDPSHNKLKEYADVDSPSVNYEWRGRDFDVAMEKIQFSGELLGKKGEYAPPISLEVDVEGKAVDFGSYQLITAKVKNLRDYYTAVQLFLSAPAEIERMDAQNKAVLLEPNEEKEIFWIVKVSDSLDQGYQYKFPVTINTMSNLDAKTFFQAIPGVQGFTLIEIQNMARQRSEEKEKIYSSNIMLSCDAESDEIYIYESSQIGCNITNLGNKYLSNLQACLGDNCQLFDMGIGQEKQIRFDYRPKKISSSVEILAKNELITKNMKVPVKVLPEPLITIESMEYPDEVGFAEKYRLKFMLLEMQPSQPEEVYISFNNNRYHLPNFTTKNTISLNNLNALDLNEGYNELNITVAYKDKRGRDYLSTESVLIKLKPLNAYQKAISGVNLFLNRISQIIASYHVRPKYERLN